MSHLLFQIVLSIYHKNRRGVISKQSSYVYGLLTKNVDNFSGVLF